MKLRLCALSLLALVIFMPACADTGSQRDSGDRVSTIPWNRPEKWEGQGALGGFMPQR
jgi:hypothetical protein